MLLGVNIDHIAVLREARGLNDPDIMASVYEAIGAGADQITVHLRENRKRIDENDVCDIIKHSKIPVNVECGISEEIIDIVCKAKPALVTLLPENPDELTTQGGLNLHASGVGLAIEKLQHADIEISLFIDPTRESIDTANDYDADRIELHTGTYADIYAMLNSNLRLTKYAIKAYDKPAQTLKELLKDEMSRIRHLSAYAKGLGIRVAAGNGLNYQNVKPLIKNAEIFELNIGQSIVARAVFVGFANAIKEMKNLIS